MEYAALACRGLVGLVFAVSAFTKIRNVTAYREFGRWLADLPAPLPGPRALAPLLAGTEVAIVALTAVPATAVTGLALAAFTLAFLTAGTAAAVSRDAPVSCHCFGPSRAALAMRHVLRNGLLLAAALTGALAAGAGAVRPAGIALSLAAAVAGATFVVFLDDLAFLVRRDPAASAGPVSSGPDDWAARP
jgi:Methylamine utilisation protein MauE